MRAAPRARSLARSAWHEFQSRGARTDSRGRVCFEPEPGSLLRPTATQAKVAAGVATAAGVVYFTHLEPVPVTGRSHLVLCSVATERKLGDAAYEQVRREFARAILPPDSPAHRRVVRVGQRIVDTLRDPSSGLGTLAHLKGARWRFTVVQSPQVNAFAVPNGRIVVFTGLLQLFPDDNELAVVLAHEVAHVVARHSAEKLSQGLIATLLKVGLALATGVQGITDSVVDIGLSLPFSRRAETEADSIGLTLLARACYDPSVAPAVFQKLTAQHAHEPPAWLSTHPAGAERSKAMKEAAPKAVAIYQASGCPEWRPGMGMHSHRH